MSQSENTSESTEPKVVPAGKSAEEVAVKSEVADTSKISKGHFGTPVDIDESSVRLELAYIWAGHHAVGLKGKMCLYTLSDQKSVRSQHEGLKFWFGPNDTDAVIAELKKYYNGGILPNTPMLLNPIVHKVKDAGDGKLTAKPLGAGIMWCTAMALGVDRLDNEALERILDLGVFHSPFERGDDNKRAGLKIMSYTDRIVWPMPDGVSTELNEAFYDIINLEAPLYYPLYFLSGVKYLTLHGLFHHSNAALLIPTMGEKLPAVIKKDGTLDLSKDKKLKGFQHDSDNMQNYVKLHQMNPQKVLDARQCWDAYDRIHSLYMKWGKNPKHIHHNNRFYDLCARDIALFDATGPMRKGADDTFEFLVPGILPRGAITILAASGGCGKSSIAHELCVYCSSDYLEGEPKPFWLGQPVNTDATRDGICVYFSGEDGPAIINARGELYDPEGRSKRLQFHRADFGSEETSFAQFITERIMKMPNVPLVVVDPARKYLSGNEEDSETVNEFFVALEELAMVKNCAVVVVHHLKKGAKPKSIPEVLDELRGSQVFIDRARVVLGMFREGIHTVVGLAKNNIPPSLGMITGERLFVRNPKTLKLMWVPGEEGTRRDTLTQDELDKMEFESFQQQLEAAKAGGSISAEDADSYVPPSMRND